MKRAILIAALVGATLAGLYFVCIHDRSIVLRRRFGEYRLAIKVVYDDETDHDQIQASYYPWWAIFRGYSQHDLPRNHAKTTFTIIVDESSPLVCIHDNNNYGFLMLIDRSNHDWEYCPIPGERWAKQFDDLLHRYPNIPHRSKTNTTAEGSR